MLPTRVGMVRRSSSLNANRVCAPHPRGDGPRQVRNFGRPIWCSPPAWGWSARCSQICASRPVLPTRVGMVRIATHAPIPLARAPHPRGDGPFVCVFCRARILCSRPAWGWSGDSFDGMPPPCSPPAWGWSESDSLLCAAQYVLPTRVGMVQHFIFIAAVSERAPHPRGDGPDSTTSSGARWRCSPPAWGWSGSTPRPLHGYSVLPTRVGMVRPRCPRRPGRCCAPHPRGDGPTIACQRRSRAWCSPPAWGWSVHRRRQLRLRPVLPTRVGMVRWRAGRCARRPGAPHPRGDGPIGAWGLNWQHWCSPPAWGWSGADEGRARCRPVLPTRVGMVRAACPAQLRLLSAPHPRGDGPFLR